LLNHLYTKQNKLIFLRIDGKFAKFCKWYNHSHRHSGLKFVTPAQRHDGKDIAILEQRKCVYEEAKLMHPECWSGKKRDWNHGATVERNPANESACNLEMKKAA
jgi:hypothetical protein